jgi:Sugar (pentulose and hexulose) kinases
MSEDNKYVVTIDYGTQSVRVSIIDEKGVFLGFEQERYAPAYFSVKPGYAEQNPDYYFECMCKAARRLSDRFSDLLAKCESISSTCFRDSAVFLDENYKSVRPAIIWLDQRQAKLERKIPKIYSFAFWLVGMRDTITLNRKRTPALWVQENEPKVWAKCRYYVPMNLYLNYRLIGVLKDSASNMIGHFPVNFKTGKNYGPNAPKGCIYGVDPIMVPSSCDVGENIGAITEEAHKLTGLPVGLKYLTTGFDKSCEALGCGAISKNIAHISYGTSSTIAVVSKRYFEPEPFLPSYRTCYPGFYSGEVQIYRGYWMLRWFSNEFAEKQSIEAEIENLTVEDILNKKLLSIKPGCDGLLLQPYWGPGLRRPLAKGAIIGFYDVHTKYHVYRAIIEGIAFALKEGLESIRKKTHSPIEYITVSGGGSRSDAICQITSDIFNIKVLKSETYESSSLGVAMAQFISLGVYKDAEEAKAKMVRYVKTFYPNKENAQEYIRLYKKAYKKIYPSLQKVYKELHDLQSNS